MSNLIEAYNLAHRGKTDTQAVIAFDKAKMYNLNSILIKLQNKQWNKIFRYYRFNIYEPKERIVDALTFEGRIVQHILCDKILRPYFEPRLIKENCACRVNKGTDYAINLVKQGLVKYLKAHSDGYVLKIDVKKYFPSVDRTVLKDLIRDFPDTEILTLLYWIIDSAPESNGLPIGNQTSQWFALYYLDRIDRIIKEKYRIKIYARYMDDLIIIHESKEVLQRLLADLRQYASDKLKLKFNQKTQITPLHKGFTFLGWRFLYTDTKRIIMRIDTGKCRLRVHKIRKAKYDLKNHYITRDKYDEKMQSMRANLIKGNAYQFMKKHDILK